MILTSDELAQLNEQIDAPITTITANYVRAKQLLEAAQKIRDHSIDLAEVVVKLKEENQGLANQLKACGVQLEDCKSRVQPHTVDSWRMDGGEEGNR